MAVTSVMRHSELNLPHQPTPLVLVWSAGPPARTAPPRPFQEHSIIDPLTLNTATEAQFSERWMVRMRMRGLLTQE